MSDITERLATMSGYQQAKDHDLCHEAIDEIKYLRARCQSHARSLEALARYFDPDNKKAGNAG